MKETRFVIIALVAILHCPFARAGESVPAPVVFVTHFLQLSPDQVGAMITMMQARDAALQPIAETLRARRETLAALLESPAADPVTAGRLLIEIHAGEQQVRTVAREAAASFEAILTPAQRERLHFVRQAARIQPAIPPFAAVGLLEE